MRTVLTLVVLFVLATTRGHTQNLSTDVYPTDEELFNAVVLGEISFSDYLTLKEIIANGIDSTTRYILDEVPNLAALLKEHNALPTELEQEQQQPFIAIPITTREVTGEWHHVFYQELTEQERSRYRSTLRLFAGNTIRAKLQSEREYSGKERFTRRSISYRNKHSILCELIVGNFTRRLGLGTVYGYRGKLLASSTKLNNESILYPDYGGANGLYVYFKGKSPWSLQALVSINKDTEYRIASSATTVTWQNDTWVLATTGGFTRLTDRINHTRTTDSKVSLTTRYMYDAGYIAAEICSQLASRGGFKAAVWEGRHRFSQADIRYAGWWYDNDYVDITAGSKAGNFRHRDSLVETGFDYSTKRTGITGGFLKTVIVLIPGINLVQSVVYSAADRNNYNVQSLSGIIRNVNPHLSIRIDYLQKTTRRTGTSFKADNQQTRLEARVKTGTLSMRSYIGYHTKTNQRDYWSMFLRLRMKSIQFGNIDIWSNVAQLDFKRRCINYWYGYVRNEYRLFMNLYSGFKLSHRYNRHTEHKHLTTITMEVTAQI